MNKLLVFVAFVIGTATAGRILQTNLQQDIGIANQRIQRMSGQDLQRQKFILDIVQGVRQQLQQDDLLQLDRGLIADPDRYRGGIDGEMQRIIELDRQRRLLDEHQTYNINDVEHVQLLRGIYRLLVRAIDFETLQQNVVYLRRNANPVLLINALALAVRDREDTQNLIIPAVQELLPEVYIDQEEIERVQRLRLNLEQSSRPSLGGLVGLRQRVEPTNPLMNMIMPWRELRLTLKKQQLQRSQNRVIFLPAKNSVEGLSLITEDVGMRNFVRNLIQELAIQEIRLQQLQHETGDDRELNIDLEQRRQIYGDIGEERDNQQLDNDEEERDRLLEAQRRIENDNRDDQSRKNIQNLRRVSLERNVGNELPNVDARSDRLLHVGRRRQNIESEIGQGRRVIVNDEGRRDVQDESVHRGSLDQEIRQRIENLRNRERNDDNSQQSNDNLQSVRRDDERLVHISRRRLSQTIDAQSPRRIRPIGEGRRVEDEDNMSIEDILRLIRRDNRLSQLSDEEITEMLRRNRQRKEQTERDRFMGLVSGDRLSEGRRVEQDEEQTQQDRREERRAGGRGVSDQGIRRTIDNRRNIERDENVDNQDLPTVRRDDERLVHINRRRLGQQIDESSPRRVSSIEEGRRVEGEGSLSVESIVKLIRSDNRLGQLSDDEITEILRRNRQRKEQSERGNRQSEERSVAEEESISRGVSGQELRQRIGQNERGDNEETNDNLPTARRDDERLVHVNRRRLDQQIDDQSPRRVSQIGEGRRVEDEDNMSVEDILRLIRSDNRLSQLSDEEITEMLRRNRQRKEQTQTDHIVIRGDRLSEGRRVEQEEDQIRGNNQNEEDLQSVRRDDERLLHINRRRLNRPLDESTNRDVNHIGKSRRVRDVNNRIGNIRSNSRRSDLDEEIQSRRSSILLQTLRQLLARINQERISLRLSNDDLQLSDDSRLILPNQNQAQRYVLRLNELRLDSRRNRVLIEQINALENRLQQVIGQLDRELDSRNTVTERNQEDEQLRIERVLGDVVLGRLGDVGILRILREQLQDVDTQTDRLGQYVSLRSPVLQYALRRIVNIVDEQQSQRLGAYRREQLDMQSVNINDVRVSKLRTRIEESDMDISNMQGQLQRVELVLRQRRLNSKPFTIDMDISSNRAQDAIIRLFLGPRQDVNGRELTLDQRRSDFILLDAINTKLQPGRNRIQQLSANIAYTSPDATSYSEIYRRVMTAIRSQQGEQQLTELVGETGRFPQRLLLPRGRPEGLPMQLLVVVSPIERVERDQKVRLDRIGGVIGVSPASIEDRRPLGYPLDRRIENEQELLRLPNVQLQDVIIIHED